MHPPRILGILAAIAVLATGCTPSPGPTPVPVTPVPTCTPEFGGDPVACTPADHERMQQINERYAEAEQVVRQALHLEQVALSEKLVTVAPEAAALYDPNGPYYAHRLKVAEATKSVGLVSFVGDFKLTRVSRHAIGPDDSPAVLGLTTCIDGRETLATYSNGKKDPGTLESRVFLFTETDGVRIWTAYVDEAVTCE